MWRRPIQLPTSSNRSVTNVVIRPDRVLSTHKHPRITPEELAYIQRGRCSTPEPGHAGGPAITSPALLGYRPTWGIVLGRFLLDPYWFLVADWFAVYLSSNGFQLERSVLGFWAPFLAADLGNFFGGGLSSFWIRRSWPVGRARRTVLLIFGPSMLLLIPRPSRPTMSCYCCCLLTPALPTPPARRCFSPFPPRVSHASGRVSERPGGNRRRHRSLDLHLPDRPRHGPLFVSARNRGRRRSCPASRLCSLCRWCERAVSRIPRAFCSAFSAWR